MIARRSLGRRRASRTDREGGVLSAGDQPSGDEAGGDQIFEKRLQETAPVRPLAGEGDGLVDGLETVREQADAGPVCAAASSVWRTPAQTSAPPSRKRATAAWEEGV